jgi:hypothetical protein
MMMTTTTMTVICSVGSDVVTAVGMKIFIVTFCNLFTVVSRHKRNFDPTRILCRG